MQLTIYYDGECPFCRNFVRLSKLKEEYDVYLYNLREEPGKVQSFLTKGYNVNEGMIVVIEDKIYHGHEAVYMISALSNKITWVGNIYYFLFSNKNITKFLYPILVAGRNLTLFLLRRTKIKI